MTAAKVRRGGVRLAALALGALAIALGTGQTMAQDTGPGDGGTQADVSVYAEGLDNPRGLHFGPDGALWVAESGRGAGEIGPDTIQVPGEEIFIGHTGAFTKIKDGEIERFFSELPSHAGEDGFAAIGPSDVSIHQDGSARGVIGLFADPAERDALAPGIQFGYLGTTDNRAEVLQEVDIAAFEGQSNPDGGDMESNPYGVLAADNGGTFVVDASANALLYVDSEGSISVTAVFESRMTEVPEELQEPGMPSEIEMQPVPVSAVFGPDGAIYVAELTGFPFPQGQARIWRVEPGEQPQEFMTGFTNIIDIAFDGDGNLYVLEIDTNGLDTEPQGNGALWRVAADGGEPEMIVGEDDLLAPGGVTIGPDGALYVTNNSILPEEGQVLRVEVSAAGG